MAKRAPAEADAALVVSKAKVGYIFFSEHIFIFASHMPPVFLQSASVFAFCHVGCECRADEGNCKDHGKN